MAASSRALFSTSFLIFLFFFSFSEARDFLIGGESDGWKVPSSQSQSLNKWAEASRFQIGDTLVWNYEPGKDSVLRVSREDYLSCNVSNPIAEHSDGNTKVKLDGSGPFYFISGIAEQCEKGQKVIVVVLSERHRKFVVGSGGGFSPAPSPMMEFDGPAVAPTSGAEHILQSGGVLMVLSLVGMVLLS